MARDELGEATRQAQEVPRELSGEPSIWEIVRRREHTLASEQITVEAAIQEGRAEALRWAIAELCDVLGIELDEEKQAALAAKWHPELEAILRALARDRRWPPHERTVDSTAQDMPRASGGAAAGYATTKVPSEADALRARVADAYEEQGIELDAAQRRALDLADDAKLQSLLDRVTEVARKYAHLPPLPRARHAPEGALDPLATVWEVATPRERASDGFRILIGGARGQGEEEALRMATTELCEALGIELDQPQRQKLATMSAWELKSSFTVLAREKHWPG
jgi:hypothetical protein